ncbi:FRG domain-containing protein [Microbacterium sp. P04]|uniref:FRG domain-containing protein n=1 Tax=Microbacterium sp. P04 TaxID=3366947 RepID=UPI0037476A11
MSESANPGDPEADDGAADDLPGKKRPEAEGGATEIGGRISSRSPTNELGQRWAASLWPSLLEKELGRHVASLFPSAAPADVMGLGMGGAAPIWNLLTTKNFFFQTRSRQEDFEETEPEPSSYSDRLTSPADYFAETEVPINSMDDLHRAVRVLTDKALSVPLVWRGQQRAEWGMHSSLFLKLMRINGVKAPRGVPTGKQPYPTEDQMVDAEKAILKVARDSWRFAGLSALEIFARLQHQGAPTRLLDVTRNPYIAAWFAVEAHDEHDDHDARLFALATTPVPKAGNTVGDDDLFRLLSGSLDPFWHSLDSAAKRQELDWGTGSNRRVWIPPEYDPRIAAQNAAFVLDGVPMISSRTGSYFKTNDGHYWSKADQLASSSIYARMLSPTRKPKPNAPGLAPTFSFRIHQKAKLQIRQMMERRFGYSRATIYPDIAGLAQHINATFGEIVS